MATFRGRPEGFETDVYRLQGDGLTARLRLSRLGREPQIVLEGTTYRVRNQVDVDGRWSLSQDDRELMTATRTGGQDQALALDVEGERHTIRLDQVDRRLFRLERGKRAIVEFRADFLLGRRFTVDCLVDDVDLLTVAFALWLVLTAMILPHGCGVLLHDTWPI